MAAAACSPGGSGRASFPCLSLSFRRCQHTWCPRLAETSLLGPHTVRFLLARLQAIFPLRVSAAVCHLLFLQGRQAYWTRTPPRFTHLNMITSANTLLPMKGTFTSTRGWGSHVSLVGDTIQLVPRKQRVSCSLPCFLEDFRPRDGRARGKHVAAQGPTSVQGCCSASHKPQNNCHD